MAVWKNVLQILIFELLTGIVKGLDALMLLGDIDELTRNSIFEFKQYGKCSFSKKLCYGQEGS